ncbi:MAG: hypothetical protein KY396_02470 [Actinobacteria bacterium]|nr:hypothetical protein [Actinomycetota bacterium]
MRKGDQLVEQAADRLHELSQKAAARGGMGEVVAETLAEDAEFVRKLKPSLMRARMRGFNPPVATGALRAAPSGPQIAKRPKSSGGGPNPFVVVGAALAAGIALAKLIDWRGHAHPRR